MPNLGATVTEHNSGVVTLPIEDVKRLLAAVRLCGSETDRAWQRTAEVCAAAEGRTVPWQVAT